jgi:hypothetical protein
MQGADPEERVQLDRLQALAAIDPGRNDDALQEALALLAALDTGTGFRSEKIGFARDAFSIWFSARKWQKWGADPQVYRGILHSHVATIRFAVERLVKPVR